MKLTSRGGLAGVLLTLLLSFPAPAQTISVDELLRRIFTEPNPQPYSMTADFTADFILNIPTGKFYVHAEGFLNESRAAFGEQRKRKATITKLNIPLLLRPFTNSIKKVVADYIEVEQKPGDILPYQDVFIAEERGDRFLLGGVRADIVTATMKKYGQEALLKDETARRSIARWLWAPSQRASIVRGGAGPYMLTALVDENGLMYELTLAYDWGQVGNRIVYVTMGGRAFWKEVNSDSSSEVAGIGKVDGTMTLHVTNHCLNCPPR
jgi:hypothetical protein